MDAHTGNHCGLVLEAEGSEVQTARCVMVKTCESVDSVQVWSGLVPHVDKGEKQEGADSFNIMLEQVSRLIVF